MSSSRWSTAHDLYLYLSLMDTDGFGKTGEVPQVAVKLIQEVDGTPTSVYYWDNSGSLTASVTFNDMTEVDSVNEPGLYSYIFSQSLLGEDRVYLAYFSSSLGFAVEKHYFSLSGSMATVNFYESED